jgi:ADP-ribose pyrophosphatase YjhB (NUDIX family)
MRRKQRPFVFVLMPFSKAWDRIYDDGIRPACNDAGYTCARVDDQFFIGTILQQIYDQIAQADAIVADVTTCNPNVFYELGWSHACGKKTICLIKKRHPIPFDLTQYRHIQYTDSKNLRRQLAKELGWLLSHPAQACSTSDPTFKRVKAQITAEVHRVRMREELPLRPALKGTELEQSLHDLDFEFAWGAIEEKPFRSDKVMLHWSEEPWSPPAMVADLVWREAYRKARFAAEHDRDFRFRPLGRVTDGYVESGQLNLLLEPTMYALFAATNLNLDNEAFRKIIQASVLDASEYSRQPFLASALNVVGCVFGKDNCVLLPKRSNAVFQNPGTFQASTGGFVEEHERLCDGEAAKPHEQAAAAFTREIHEELGIRARELSHVEFVGFGYNRRTGEPDLIAVARTCLTGRTMMRRYAELRLKRAKQADNADELAIIETRGRFKSYWQLGEHPNLTTLARLCRFLREEHLWSDPSDIVAVLGGICRIFGVRVVRKAFQLALR